MALRLEIVSAHRASIGERAIMEFGEKGGSIGRSLQSDWILPDAQRYVSSRHAAIDFRSGSYYIIDLSMNGVYVNGAEQPVGRGKPQRLFNGDRLHIGDYEILVHVDEASTATEPVFSEKHVDPVDLAQRVAPPEEPGPDLIDPFEITGVGFQEITTAEDETSATRTSRLIVAEIEVPDLELAVDENEQASAVPAPQPARASESLRGARAVEPVSHGAALEPRRAPPGVSTGATSTSRATGASRAPSAGRAATTGHAPAASPQPPASSLSVEARAAQPSSPSGVPMPAIDAFFRGAGIAGASGMDARQAERVLLRAGQLVRELILGVIESLQVRAEQKNHLRLPNTTIQRQANNPLKFAAGIDEALHNLFFRESSEYLSAVDAVREALRDIKQHQHLLLGALPKALADYIGRLDPDELEEKFSGGKRGTLRAAAGKLRYWDLYKDLYQVVANRTPGQLPPQFIEELARIYEQEASRTPAPTERKTQLAG